MIKCVYRFGSTPNERLELDDRTKLNYETKMSEWLAVEAIVRQREEEKTAKALAKIAYEQEGGKGASWRRESLEVEVGNISDLSDLSVDVEEEQKSNEVPEVARLSSKSMECIKKRDSNQIRNGNLLKLDWEGQHSQTENYIKSSPSTSSYETVANEFPVEIEVLTATPCQENVLLKASEMGTEKPGIEGDSQMASYYSVEDVHLMVSEMTEEEADPTVCKVVGSSARTSLISSLNEEPTVIALDTPQDQVSTCPSPVSSNSEGIYMVSSYHDALLL